MLDEHGAAKAVHAALPDIQVIALALAFPVGTTRAQGVGMLVGDVLGAAAGGSSGAATGSGLGLLGADIAERAAGGAASYVLAATASTVEVFGRHHVGPLAGFHDLFHVTSLPREGLSATTTRHGIVQDLTLTEPTGATLTVELKPLGSGLEQFLAAVAASSDGAPAV